MKHRRPNLLIPATVAIALGLFAWLGPAQTTEVSAQVPPPAGPTTPSPTFNPGAPVPAPAPTDAVPPTPSPSPSPTPVPCGKHHKNCPSPGASGAPTPSPEPSSTPTSPAFATLDGTWEVQLQTISGTTYSYLTIAQQPTGTISGVWKVDGKSNPFEGTYDGRLIRMLVHKTTGNVTMSGYVEGATDMVGIVDLGNGSDSNVAFTAEHRGSKGSPFKKKPN